MVDPLWRRSPLALRRHPGVLISIALGAALLALGAAAYPLFISSTSTDLLASRLNDPNLTRYGAGVVYSQLALGIEARSPDSSLPLHERIDSIFRRATSFLGPTVSGIEGPPLTVSGSRSATVTDGRLFSATDAIGHIQMIAGREGSGVLVPDTVAAAVHVEPGDSITMTSQTGASTSVPVDGIYRALYLSPHQGYWRAWGHDIWVDQCRTLDCPVPPQFLIMDDTSLLDTSRALGDRQINFTWVAPVPTTTKTLDQARSIASSIAAFEQRISDPSDPYGVLFGCCGRRAYEPTGFASGMAQVVRDVDERVTQLQGPGQLLTGAGIFVALIVIVVAGSFSVSARRVENELLFARGASPGTVVAKAALEDSIPIVVGSILGLAAAWALVSAFGPGGAIARSARDRAAWGTVLAAFATLALLCAVAFVGHVRRAGRERAGAPLIRRLPWEVVPAVLSLFALQRLRSGGALVIDPVSHLSRPSPYLLAFPLLFLLGFGALAARGATSASRALRDRSAGFGPAPYLAVHRLAGTTALTTSLIAASALCFGLFVQAQTLVGSLRSTVNAKAEVFVGSDVEGRVSFDTPPPQHPAFPFTRVSRVVEGGTIPGGPDVDLLTLDPSTFASAAYWKDSFSAEPLPSLLASLRSPGSAVPVIVAGGAGVPDPTSIEISGTPMPVRVVGHAVAFPGMSSTRPLIVADESRFVQAYHGAINPLATSQATTEFWIRGPTDDAARYLASLRYSPYLILTAEEVKDIPSIVAVIDTFAVLNLLGIAAALLVLAGVLVYLQARRRSQLVSYGLSLRMGMTDAAHRRSLVIELTAILGSAFLVGVIGGIAVSSLMVPLLDPLTTIHPAPLFVIPAAGLAIAALVVAFVSWGGGWYTNLRERATDLGQVMRLAE